MRTSAAAQGQVIRSVGQFLQLMMRQGSSWAIGLLPGSAPVAAQRAVLFRPTRNSLSRFAGLEPVSRRDPHPGLPMPACHDLAAVTLIPGGSEVGVVGTWESPELGRRRGGPSGQVMVCQLCSAYRECWGTIKHAEVVKTGWNVAQKGRRKNRKTPQTQARARAQARTR